MKVITGKNLDVAVKHLAGLLKNDGAEDTRTVQEWLDVAQFRPAQFRSSLPALEMMGLLGLRDVLVKPEPLG